MKPTCPTKRRDYIVTYIEYTLVNWPARVCEQCFTKHVTITTRNHVIGIHMVHQHHQQCFTNHVTITTRNHVIGIHMVHQHYQQCFCFCLKVASLETVYKAVNCGTVATFPPQPLSNVTAAVHVDLVSWFRRKSFKPFYAKWNATTNTVNTQQDKPLRVGQSKFVDT